MQARAARCGKRGGESDHMPSGTDNFTASRQSFTQMARHKFTYNNLVVVHDTSAISPINILHPDSGSEAIDFHCFQPTYYDCHTSHTNSTSSLALGALSTHAGDFYQRPGACDIQGGRGVARWVGTWAHFKFQEPTTGWTESRSL
jgi:hypothetical protein